MNVFVLTGHNQYAETTVLGVYTSRDTAQTAAIKFNGDAEYTYDYYFINEVTVDAFAVDRNDGVEVEVE